MEIPLLLDVVDRLANKLAPVEYQTAGIDWTDHWSTFFFLRLKANTECFSLPAGSHRPEVGPHISLLYRFQPGLERETLREELATQMPLTVRFDRLALVCPVTGRWKDVEGWKTLHSVGLFG
jgi:hypothetical protein